MAICLEILYIVQNIQHYVLKIWQWKAFKFQSWCLTIVISTGLNYTYHFWQTVANDVGDQSTVTKLNAIKRKQ